MGREHFWLTVVPVQEAEEGTDRWAVERGLVSMTPLRLDLTDAEALERVRRVALGYQRYDTDPTR
jgi:5'-nucleotidase